MDPWSRASDPVPLPARPAAPPARSAPLASSHNQADHHCTRWPCLAYVGIYGAANTTFSLLMTEEDDESPIKLSDGIEQRKSLPHAGSYGYFTFFAGAGAVGEFEVSITPTRW